MFLRAIVTWLFGAHVIKEQREMVFMDGYIYERCCYKHHAYILLLYSMYSPNKQPELLPSSSKRGDEMHPARTRIGRL